MFTMLPLSPTEILIEQLLERQEGFEILPYDDATGRRVHAPAGAITWGFGFNLEECGSHDLFVAMLTFLVRRIETQIRAYRWWVGQPVAVQVALLDIAYNAGVGGLLHYPEMLSMLIVRDYAGAAAQCQTQNPKLASRYRELASMIASAAAPSAAPSSSTTTEPPPSAS